MEDKIFIYLKEILTFLTAIISFFHTVIYIIFSNLSPSLINLISWFILLIIIAIFEISIAIRFYKRINNRYFSRIIRIFKELHILPIQNKIISERNKIIIFIILILITSMTYYLFKYFLSSENFKSLIFFSIFIYTLIYILLPLVSFLIPNIYSLYFLIFLLFFTSFGVSDIFNIENLKNLNFIPQILLLPPLLYVISFHIDFFIQLIIYEVNEKLKLPEVRRKLPLFLLKVENDKIEGKIIRMNYEIEELEIITKNGIKYFISLNKVNEPFAIKYNKG